jgi:UDP-xylose/UDP-N-acetylglucosamine transporter B4
MARKKADSDSSRTSMPGQQPTRRRATLREIQATTTAIDGGLASPKVINAAPSLQRAEMYGIDDERPTSAKVMAIVGRIFMETIPQWMAVGAMLGLIFGGCCSNVRKSS